MGRGVQPQQQTLVRVHQVCRTEEMVERGKIRETRIQQQSALKMKILRGGTPQNSSDHPRHEFQGAWPLMSVRCAVSRTENLCARASRFARVALLSPRAANGKACWTAGHRLGTGGRGGAAWVSQGQMIANLPECRPANRGGQGHSATQPKGAFIIIHLLFDVLLPSSKPPTGVLRAFSNFIYSRVTSRSSSCAATALTMHFPF